MFDHSESEGLFLPSRLRPPARLPSVQVAGVGVVFGELLQVATRLPGPLATLRFVGAEVSRPSLGCVLPQLLSVPTITTVHTAVATTTARAATIY